MAWHIHIFTDCDGSFPLPSVQIKKSMIGKIDNCSFIGWCFVIKSKFIPVFLLLVFKIFTSLFSDVELLQAVIVIIHKTRRESFIKNISAYL